jgi:hypothetical protein
MQVAAFFARSAGAAESAENHTAEGSEKIV